MPAVSCKPGMFCWADLNTPDAAAAKKFYHEILGVTALDIPMSETMTYTMLHKDGKNIGALFQDSGTGGVPRWDPYIMVENLEEMAAKVTELGGEVILGPMEVGEPGRMLVIRDPGNAFVSLWQAKSHTGFDITEEVGAITWFELNTHQPAEMFKFYSALLGWEGQNGEDGTGYYTHFICGGAKQAGMMQIQPEWGEVPPHWLTYFQIDNLNRVMELTLASGGKVYNGPINVEGTGVCAVLADPQGIVFGAIEITG